MAKEYYLARRLNWDMDKGLAIAVIACISMLVFFVGYQLSVADLPDDQDWDSSIVVDVMLKGDSIAVSSSRPVVVNGSRLTIGSAGTYRITGSLNDGQIVVYAKDEGAVKLILNGVNIHCSSSAPICVVDAEEVEIFLEAGTENFVSDGASYAFSSSTENEPNAAVFSKSNLTISGNGWLNVVGNYNDGIASKDALVIESGSIVVSAVDDGIRGRDCIVVKDGNISLDAGGDGLKSDNAENAALGYVSVLGGLIDIESGGDAFQAETNVSITAGSFNLTSGGGSGSIIRADTSAKGIKGVVGVVINGGSFAIDSADDAIHSNETVTINGGSFTLSSGDDALHADGSVQVNGGDINVVSSFEGVEGAIVTITDGTLHVASVNDGIDAVVSSENPDSGVVSVANGVINIVSGGDAIQAEKNVLISGGEFVLTSSGGSDNLVAAGASAKGIKAVVSIVVNGGAFTISSADDALHSNGTVTVNQGSFMLSSGGDAIHADGSMEINGGDINIVKSFEGVEGALVTVNGGEMRIVSSNNGIDAVMSAEISNSGVVSVVNGMIDVKSGGDAIQAETNVLISDGSFTLISGGGSNSSVAGDVSAKGIKGVVSIVVDRGTFTINSADDAIHSNGTITVNGGSFTLSSGDDALHADGSVELNGGYIDIVKSFEGVEGALVTINAGNISIFSSDDGIDAAISAEISNSGVLSVVDGVINIRSGGDAFQGETNVLITGGSFNLTSGGGSGGVVVGDVSTRGIKGVTSVTIDAGSFVIDSADDAIHSNGNVTINGGVFTLSSGDDTIHADGSVQVNGGDITIVDSIWVDPGGDPWDSSVIVNVELKGTSIAVSASRPAVVDGSKVILRSAGTYNITGSLTDGQIIVYTRDQGPVKLILNGVNINCSTSAPICILDADEVVIFLEAGTENSVRDAASYVFASPSVNEPNAAIFSKSDLTISGDGLLRVVGNYNDGIASKDGLIIESGNLIVSSVDDGIRGKDYLVVESGSIALEVGGDGLKSDNAENATLGYVLIQSGTIDIVSGGDAFDAESNVLITGGSFDLTSGGGSSRTVGGGVSAKGIKGTAGVTIEAGTFVIDSADDAIHSNGNVTINGGSVVLSTSDDGIHADKTIKINNGEIEITESYEGIEAPVVTINNGVIHVVSSDDGVNMGADTGFMPGPGGGTLSMYSGSNYLYINGGYLAVNANGDGVDSNGAIVMTGGVVLIDGPSDDMNSALDHEAFNMTGGVLVAVGSSGMALPPGTLSTQYSVMLNFQSRYSAGTLIHVQKSDGTEVFTFRPTKQFQSVVFSFPSLALGSTYEVYVRGSCNGTITDGLYSGGTYTPGTKYTTFTISTMVTRLGPSGMFFPGF